MSNFLEILKNIKFKIINAKCFWRNNIVLTKDNGYNNAIIEFSPLLIKAKNNNDIELFSEKLKNFLIVMQRDCKNFDPTIFLNNFKKTIFDIEKISKNNLLGKTKFDKRIINNYYIESLICCNHEFFHLSAINSSRYNEFLTYILPFEEGYTVLLDSRYFYNDVTSSAYILETAIMKNIELILGKDYLEKVYFNGHFSSFIFELEKYENSDNINELFSCVNEIWQIENDEDVSKIGDIEKYIIKIFNILFSCLKNKIEEIDDIKEKIEILESSEFRDFVLYVASTGENLTISTINKTEYNEILNELYENLEKNNKKR